MSDQDEDNSSLTSLVGVIFSKASSVETGMVVSPSGTASTSAAAADPVADLAALIRRAISQVDNLSLISDNDTLDDLPTTSLRAVLLRSIQAQVTARSQTPPGNFPKRAEVLQESKRAYYSFLTQLLNLSILNTSSSDVYLANLSKQVQHTVNNDQSPYPEDATSRRASKVAAMKLERALVQALDAYRTAARANVKALGASIRSTTSSLSIGPGQGSESLSTAYDTLILPKKHIGDDDDDDEDDDDSRLDKEGAVDTGSDVALQNGVRPPKSLRAYLLLLCRLHALLALNALDSIFSELQVLRSMPPSIEQESQQRAAKEREEQGRRKNDVQDDWRIEQRWGASNSGALLDKKGKPLRPFTILPGGTSGSSVSPASPLDARQQLRDQVFRPSHRLPTMTMDEYLAEEERRGNIIRDGGAASAARPTTKETLALRSEGGQGAGTREAEEADEEQRLKAIDWDEFTENNPKGIGNTMNRG